MLSFSTFTHLKSETIAQMLREDGRIELNIRPKEFEPLELTIISRKRAKEFEEIEKEIISQRRALAWERENLDAIKEQNERIARRGIFSDSIRRF